MRACLRTTTNAMCHARTHARCAQGGKVKFSDSEHSILQRKRAVMHWDSGSPSQVRGGGLLLPLPAPQRLRLGHPSERCMRAPVHSLRC